MDNDNVIQFPTGRIGNHPAPSDDELVRYITEMRDRDAGSLERLLSDLKEMDSYGESDGQPEAFTYARLVNYLTNGLDIEDVIHFCAAAVWSVYGQEGNELPS